MMTHEEQIIICAVRYTLGRMSYIVGVVCEYVALKNSELSEHCIAIIIRAIREELQRYHDIGQALGMECDEGNWISLLEILEEERDSRNDR